MNMSSRIKVLGYYGMYNYGDDLFSLLSYRAITENFHPTRCDIIDDNFYSVNKNVRKNYSNPNILGQFARLSSYLYSTINTDYFIFCGGSLYSREGLSLADTLYLVNFNRYKFQAMGVSVGPFTSKKSEKRVIEILKEYEYISLRDKRSFERVKGFNLDAKVILAGDLAGLGVDYLVSDMDRNRNNDKKIIGFSPCNMGNKQLAKTYVFRFISSMKRLKKMINFEVNIICLNQNNINGDMALCELAKELLKSLNIESKVIKYKDIGVEQTWIEISKLDFFVSARLHGAITAYLNRVPFFLYEYHEKCTEFLKFIDDDTHDITDSNNDFLIADRILTSLYGQKKLMTIESFAEKSRLNITENPLYIEE